MSADKFMADFLDGLPTGHRAVVWVLPDRRTVSYPADPAKAVQAVEKADSKQRDVYVGAGFVTTATAHSTGAKGRQSKKTVAGLFGLFLDLDVKGSPDRNGGRKKTGAPSKDAALDLASRIVTPTLTVDSGHGAQAWYLFDQPWVFASEDEREQAADLFAQFQEAHRQHVPWRIDSTHSLTQVGRVPGTLNRKADPVPVQLLHTGGRYPVADLAAVAEGVSRPRKAASAAANAHAEVPADRVAALMASPGVAAVLDSPPSDQSDRDYAVVKEAMRVHASDAEIGALVARVREEHGDDKGKGEDARYVAGHTIPAARAELQAEAGNRSRRNRRLGVTWASEVTPRNPTFAWDGRAPLGAVTILGGLEGLGKSTLTAYLAAGLTTGTLPGHLLGKPSVVLFASHEDSLEETAVPRLLAAEADLSRVGFLATDLDEDTGTLVLPDDMARLSREIDDTGARLVVIDPIAAYVSASKRENSEQDVRAVLDALRRLGAKHNAAFLVIKHLNKDEGASFLSRVSGSRGYSAAARSVLAFGRDPQDPDEHRGPMRVLAHPKCNVADEQPSLAFRVEPRHVHHGGDDLFTSRLVAGGEHDARAEDLLDARTTPEEGARVAAAIDWLRDELAGGPRVGAEVRDLARKAGHAQSTLYRARDKLGVQQVAVEGGDGRVKGWGLPAKGGWE